MYIIHGKTQVITPKISPLLQDEKVEERVKEKIHLYKYDPELLSQRLATMFTPAGTAVLAKVVVYLQSGLSERMLLVF